MHNQATQRSMLSAVSEALASFRDVKKAASAAIDHLTFSQRQSLRTFLEGNLHDAFSDGRLRQGEDLADRLRDQVRQLGGAPGKCWTDEGDGYQVGGTEGSTLVHELVEALSRYLAMAWIAHDQIVAVFFLASIQDHLPDLPERAATHPLDISGRS